MLVVVSSGDLPKAWSILKSSPSCCLHHHLHHLLLEQIQDGLTFRYRLTQVVWEYWPLKRVCVSLLLVAHNSKHHSNTHYHYCQNADKSKSSLWFVNLNKVLKIWQFTANLKPNMISSCRKWASSSTDNTASVSIAEYGRNLLFRLFRAGFITYNCNSWLEPLCTLTTPGKWNVLNGYIKLTSSL